MDNFVITKRSSVIYHYQERVDIIGNQAFTNIRHYYPDFVVKLTNEQHWLIETKGREDIEVALKDEAAQYWCNNATELTGTDWHYLKVLQSAFEQLQPVNFQELQIGLY